MSMVKIANVNVSDNRSVSQITDYVTRDEACTGFETYNMECFLKDTEIITEEFNSLKNTYDKTDGRPYYHMIVSFTEGTDPDKLRDFMADFSQYEFFDNKQFFAAYHTTGKNPHIHVVLNSVQLDGKKIDMSRKDLTNLKLEGDRLTEKHNIQEVTQYKNILAKKQQRNKNLQVYDKDTYNALIRASQGEYKSYVFDIAYNVACAKATATSKDEFIKSLERQGIKTVWTDKRKYITFEDAEGNKVRNTRIDKYFNLGIGKEDLKNEFQSNKSSRQRNEAERDRQPERTRIKQVERGKREFERQSSESTERKQEFETRFIELQRENEQLELNRIREEERREREEKERAERHRITVEKATRQLERTICNNQQPTSRTRQDEEGFSL